MILKVFVKDGCPHKLVAKELADQFPFSKMFNMDTPEGRDEAAFHSVLCSPSFVLVDDQEMVIQSWRCHVPRSTEIANYVA